MAERLSESERLALVEELLVTLLTGLHGERPTDDWELRRQQILTAAIEQLRSSPRPSENALGPAEFKAVSAHISDLDKRLYAAERRLDQTEQIQRETLLALSSAPALASVPLRRVVPAYFYISEFDPEIAFDLERSLIALAESVGLEVIYEGEPEFGSWFQDFLTRTKEALTDKQVQQRLEKAERALELKHLDSIQAKADLDLSKAAKNISDILSKVPEGVVCLGSITGIKTAGGSLVIMTLTQDEMLQVAKDPSLKKSPDKLLDLLARHRNASASQTSAAVKANPLKEVKDAKQRGKTTRSLPPPKTLDS